MAQYIQIMDTYISYINLGEFDKEAGRYSILKVREIIAFMKHKEMNIGDLFLSI
jgi:hypothetical protein